MGRHDLDAVFVEDVLDIGVQGVHDRGARRRFAGYRLADQPVLRVEIGQGGLEDLGRRSLLNARSTGRRLDQHGMHLTPGCVVADGNGGVEDIPVAVDRPGIVTRDIVQDQGIGERQLLSEAGEDPGGKSAGIARGVGVGEFGALLLCGRWSYAKQKRARLLEW